MLVRDRQTQRQSPGSSRDAALRYHYYSNLIVASHKISRQIWIDPVHRTLEFYLQNSKMADGRCDAPEPPILHHEMSRYIHF